MTEYWVSNAKHYCDYCNTWTQGDSVSIKRHEATPRHEKNMSRVFNGRRRDKEHEEWEVQKQTNQIRKIEKAAERRQKIYLKQKKRTAVSERIPTWEPSCSFPPPPPTRIPPPPPPRPDHMPKKRQRQEPKKKKIIPEKKKQRTFEEEVLSEVEEVEEVVQPTRGFYTIRGVDYLDVSEHAEKIKKGGTCEIWVDESEEWISAEVTDVDISKEDGIIIQRTFALSYWLNRIQVHEKKVLSDRLRIKVVPNETLVELETRLEAEAHVDHATGYGQWSTVTVREFDDEEEKARIAGIAKREEEEKEKRTREKEVKNVAHVHKNQVDVEGEEQSGDALSTYNPYGGNTYKGVVLTNNETYVPPVRGEAMDNGIKVQFKKRKTTKKLKRQAF